MTCRASKMRTVLMFSAILATAPAWAGWTLVKSADGSSHYVDPLTLRTSGHIRRISELTSTTLSSKGGAASHRMVVEYDCKDERYRLLQLTAFTGPMGTGAVFGAVDYPAGAAEWHPASPGTVAADALRVVCAL
ncbi:MAG: hypothetical protein HXY24_06665 [Rubrivivax sp.]|nr:hypothetical protein [Rubrivivax sp.]